ncbi:hypothetical protein [Psittacicella hinzii]|uniref:Uncharacterized protein n=1 Tax=Psittacicella hinzii TaxID=2028575 RepID=A0A3A1YLI0_9GAMM|nr:hypothetical protein [Psittacicella hinzii]RIY37094.1 hypothetical protein CKF58_05380 [Psittacicella hinzii]
MVTTIYSSSEDPLDYLDNVPIADFSSFMTDLQLMLRIRQYLWEHLPENIGSILANELDLKYAPSVQLLICPMFKRLEANKLEIVVNYYLGAYSHPLRPQILTLIKQLATHRDFRLSGQVEVNARYNPSLLASAQSYDAQLKLQVRADIDKQLHEQQIQAQIDAEQIRQSLGLTVEQFKQLQQVGAQASPLVAQMQQNNLQTSLALQQLATGLNANNLFMSYSQASDKISSGQQFNQFLQEQHKQLQANVIDLSNPVLAEQIEQVLNYEYELAHAKAPTSIKERNQAQVQKATEHYQEPVSQEVPAFLSESREKAAIFWDKVLHALNQDNLNPEVAAIQQAYVQQQEQRLAALNAQTEATDKIDPLQALAALEQLVAKREQNLDVSDASTTASTNDLASSTTTNNVVGRIASDCRTSDGSTGITGNAASITSDNSTADNLASSIDDNYVALGYAALEQAQQAHKAKIDLSLQISDNLDTLQRQVFLHLKNLTLDLLAQIYGNWQVEKVEFHYHQLAPRYKLLLDYRQSNAYNVVVKEYEQNLAQPLDKQVLGSWSLTAIEQQAPVMFEAKAVNLSYQVGAYLVSKLLDPITLINLKEQASLKYTLELDNFLPWNSKKIIDFTWEFLGLFEYCQELSRELVYKELDYNLIAKFNIYHLADYNRIYQELQAGKIALPADLSVEQQAASLAQLQQVIDEQQFLVEYEQGLGGQTDNAQLAALQLKAQETIALAQQALDATTHRTEFQQQREAYTSRLMADLNPEVALQETPVASQVAQDLKQAGNNEPEDGKSYAENNAEVNAENNAKDNSTSVVTESNVLASASDLDYLLADLAQQGITLAQQRYAQQQAQLKALEAQQQEVKQKIQAAEQQTQGAELTWRQRKEQQYIALQERKAAYHLAEKIAQVQKALAQSEQEITLGKQELAKQETPEASDFIAQAKTQAQELANNSNAELEEKELRAAYYHQQQDLAYMQQHPEVAMQWQALSANLKLLMQQHELKKNFANSVNAQANTQINAADLTTVEQLQRDLRLELLRCLTVSGNSSFTAEFNKQLQRERNAYMVAVTANRNPAYKLAELQNKFLQSLIKRKRKLERNFVYLQDYLGKVPVALLAHDVEHAPYIKRIGLELALEQKLQQANELSSSRLGQTSAPNTTTTKAGKQTTVADKHETKTTSKKKASLAASLDAPESLDLNLGTTNPNGVSNNYEHLLTQLDPTLPAEQAIKKLMQQIYQRREQEFELGLFRKWQDLRLQEANEKAALNLEDSKAEENNAKLEVTTEGIISEVGTLETVISEVGASEIVNSEIANSKEVTSEIVSQEIAPQEIATPERLVLLLTAFKAVYAYYQKELPWDTELTVQDWLALGFTLEKALDLLVQDKLTLAQLVKASSIVNKAKHPQFMLLINHYKSQKETLQESEPSPPKVVTWTEEELQAQIAKDPRAFNVQAHKEDIAAWQAERNKRLAVSQAQLQELETTLVTEQAAYAQWQHEQRLQQMQQLQNQALTADIKTLPQAALTADNTHVGEQKLQSKLEISQATREVTGKAAGKATSEGTSQATDQATSSDIKQAINSEAKQDTSPETKQASNLAARLPIVTDFSKTGQEFAKKHGIYPQRRGLGKQRLGQLEQEKEQLKANLNPQQDKLQQLASTAAPLSKAKDLALPLTESRTKSTNHSVVKAKSSTSIGVKAQINALRHAEPAKALPHLETFAQKQEKFAPTVWGLTISIQDAAVAAKLQHEQSSYAEANSANKQEPQSDLAQWLAGAKQRQERVAQVFQNSMLRFVQANQQQILTQVQAELPPEVLEQALKQRQVQSEQAKLLSAAVSVSNKQDEQATAEPKTKTRVRAGRKKVKAALD